MTYRLAIIQFPGSNCEYETQLAANQYGFEADIFRWTETSRSLSEYDGYILPGGFSYQDRVRAGVMAAKLPLMDHVGRASEEGKPILGICNGCQILVESGLVPHCGPDPMICLLYTSPSPRDRG